MQPEAAPFPDIPAEAPGILTEHEEIHGASPIQDEPTQSDEERAALAAENSGIEFRPINVRETAREVFELLDDDNEDVLNNFIRDDVAIKIEQQNNEDLRKVVEEKDEDEENEPISDEPRKLSRDRVLNRKFEDYELCHCC